MNEQEQMFLSLVGQHRQIIYKVCFMYASHQRPLSGGDDKSLESLPTIPWRQQTYDLGLSHCGEHLRIVVALVKQTAADCTPHGLDGRPLS